MSESVDTVVLYNQLAYHEVLPVQWVPHTQPLTRFELDGLDQSNLVLLQACVALEERPGHDHGEEAGPLAAELARLDFKLNLILQLLGRLVLKDRMAPATSIRFNAQGASWTAIGALPEAQEHGLLRIHLHESLPQALELAGTVSGADGAQVRVRFDAMAENVAELIQRLAFLRHRRDVADARKSRAV